MNNKKLNIKFFIPFFALMFILSGVLTPTLSIKAATSANVKVNYINVGQGDAELIQSNGHNMLIDTGTNASESALNSYLKKAGVKTIDVLVLTHPHEDHIGGADMVIKNYKIGRIYMPKVTTNTQTFSSVMQAIKSKNLKITAPVPGATFKVGNAAFTIVAPNKNSYEDLNNYSIVIRMVYGKTSFMFDGDAGTPSEQEMMASKRVISANVLKLGHHGSSTASSDAFLDKVKPKYAIISCGKNNDYGHPNDETIVKLLKRHIAFYRTDVNGNIVCITNGTTLSFSTSSSKIPNNNITPNSPKGVKVSGVSTKVSSTAATKTTTSKVTNGNTIVYITKTGKDYHTAKCSSLKHSKIAIKLSDAVKRGYKPHLQDGAPVLK